MSEYKLKILLQFLLHLLTKLSFFRMEMNKALNVSYNFNGYLVCQMPDNMVEVELKVKTMMGKYTLFKDFYTRTERYCPWDRADRRVHIHTRRKRTPQREIKVKTIP